MSCAQLLLMTKGRMAANQQQPQRNAAPEQPTGTMSEINYK